VTSSPTSTARPEAVAVLPPHEYADIAALFDPLVAPLGYRVTRGALIDRSDYQPTPEGGHLAIYLAPLTDSDLDTYAADFLPLARLLFPHVFAEWPDLESFDFCQEPFLWDGPADPPPFTLLETTRSIAAEVDWATVGIPRLRELAAGETGAAMWITPDVAATDTWLALEPSTP
jgi:hypothetical protein